MNRNPYIPTVSERDEFKALCREASVETLRRIERNEREAGRIAMAKIAENERVQRKLGNRD